MPTLLAISGLRVEYRTATGVLPAISDFSLEILAGESFGLVGESGCGKSTLAMAIMGHLERNGAITAGEIRFEGKDLVAASEAELERIRGRRIAVVYQEPSSALNPTMTIGRQLMEVPMHHGGVSAAEARRLAARMLTDVDIADPDAVLNRYPHQLSGGQKQRVVIAMALLANPALLLLDEPTTGLDVTVAATVLDLIRELREKYGTTLLYISHNLGVIAKVCDRIGVMYAGELVEEARAAELFSSPSHPYTRGLLGCVPRLGATKHTAAFLPIRGQVPPPHARPPGCAFGPRCDSFLSGLCDRGPIRFQEVAPAHRARCERWRELSPPRQPGPVVLAAGPAREAPALVVEELSKVYELGSPVFWLFGRGSRVVANEDLSFTAQRGHVLAIVGESGSGKSTFARIVAGLESASDGALRFGGADLARVPVSRRTAQQVAAIQMVFQNPDGTLNPSHSVGWPIARALRKFGIARARRTVDQRVKALLEMVRLPASIRYRTPRQLSGGQKQRIAIARAFAGNPELILADEPVSALDVSVQAAIVNLLLQIQAEQGTTMLFISHDLALVRHLADHVVVMYLGKVMEAGPVAAIFEPPYHPYTEALLSAIPDPSVEQKRIRLEGEAPSPVNLPSGCRFVGRCPRKLGAVCDREPPPVQRAGQDHLIACHIPLEELRKVGSIFEVSERAILSRPWSDQASRTPGPSHTE
ncbi:MAG: ABC transporter ATP-binding protein [Candidatus Rokubacteria bacterium]|nr:ABC transporter ATP-binding protein [Candidatus Rokubacteria bacterium]